MSVGWDSNCQLEPGWYWDNDHPNKCEMYWGNGVKEVGENETCDDGNQNDKDGIFVL